MKTKFLRRVLFCFFMLLILWGAIESVSAQETSSTATGISNRFNPAISVNVLLLARAVSTEPVDEHDEVPHDSELEEHEHSSHSGLTVQESEIQLAAFVDPYLKADVTLSQGHRFSAGFELEEASFRALRTPRGFGFRLGKLKAPFGRHNLLHTHGFPFVEAPWIVEEIFGEEGLVEVGVELSVLLPTSWYSEALFGVFNGDNETLFYSERVRDLGYVARWHHLFDLHPTTTLDVGVSGVLGKKEESFSRVVGGDLRVKYQPLSAVQGKTILQGEYLRAQIPTKGTVHGGYTLAQYQFSRRWWLQGGFDWVTSPDGSNKRFRAALVFVPTEFSSWKLQYNANRHVDEDVSHEILFQLNATIGTHPAHAY